MPIPVINTTTSIQDWKQWEAFEFIPFATNNPVIWQVSALPTGVTMEAAPTLYAATGVASTDIITATGNTFANGDRVFFSDLTGGTGLAVNTCYFVRDETGDTFKLATTLGGTPINFTTDISAATISKVHTGKISGYATVPGVVVAGLTAVNQDGSSAALALTFGIEPTARALNSGVAVSIDLRTGEVTGELAAAVAGALMSLKKGDNLLIYAQFKRGETVVDLGTLGSLSFGLKQRETEDLLVLGGGAPTGADGTPMEKTGSGTTTTYILAVDLDDEDLDGALLDVENDDGTKFTALAEFQWVETNPTSGNRVGPATLTRTSQTFPVEVVRDLIV